MDAEAGAHLAAKSKIALSQSVVLNKLRFCASSGGFVPPRQHYDEGNRQAIGSTCAAVPYAMGPDGAMR